MKERKIIVNKCDVSGCEFYCRYTDNCLDYKHWYDKPLCKNLPDCHYKQLKRKEQECEELKEARKNSRCAWKSLEGTFCPQAQEQLEAYKMEADEGKEINAELKAENKELKKTVDDLLHKSEIQDKILWKIDNEALMGSKDAWIYKLEKTLAEIKEIANRIYSEVITENWQSLLAKQILQKISECEEQDA